MVNITNVEIGRPRHIIDIGCEGKCSLRQSVRLEGRNVKLGLVDIRTEGVIRVTVKVDTIFSEDVI